MMHPSELSGAQIPLRAARCLDRADYTGFLALCTPDFEYLIRVWSPDIQQDMIWFDHGYESLTALFQSLPEHLLRPDKMMRHLGQSIIEEQTDTVLVLDTPLAVFLTNTKGQSHLWVTARYLDKMVKTDNGWKLAHRTTRLETRDLGIGTLEPI